MLSGLSPPIRALNEGDRRPVGVAHATLTAILSFTYGRLPEERSGQVPVSVQGKPGTHPRGPYLSHRLASPYNPKYKSGVLRPVISPSPSHRLQRPIEAVATGRTSYLPSQTNSAYAYSSSSSYDAAGSGSADDWHMAIAWGRTPVAPAYEVTNSSPSLRRP